MKESLCLDAKPVTVDWSTSAKNTKECKIVIPGNPIAKARPKVSRRGNYVTMYDPNSQANDVIKQQLKIAANSVYFDFNDVLEVECTFYMPIPTYHGVAHLNACSLNLIPHTSKPDLDNLIKQLDYLNEIIFNDDRQIVSIVAYKRYSLNPRTVIDIKTQAKLDIEEQAKGILTMFGLENLGRFTYDCKVLSEVVDAWIETEELSRANSNLHIQSVRLARIAIILATLAKNHSKVLTKIASKYPDFVLQCEQNVPK